MDFIRIFQALYKSVISPFGPVRYNGLDSDKIRQNERGMRHGKGDLGAGLHPEPRTVLAPIQRSRSGGGAG